MTRERTGGKAAVITRRGKLAGASKGNLYVKKTSLIVGIIITSVTRCEQNGSSREPSLCRERETLSANNTLFSRWLRRDDDGRRNGRVRGWRRDPLGYQEQEKAGGGNPFLIKMCELLTSN